MSLVINGLAGTKTNGRVSDMLRGGEAGRDVDFWRRNAMNEPKRRCWSVAGFATWDRPGRLLWLALLCLVAPFTVRALTLGQVDDFQDGSSQNWQTGVGPINNVANGGPTGAGDHYVQYTSTGTGGADSRMVIFNIAQWQGNYSGAEITGIAMDLNNFSQQPLSMRIAFFVNQSAGYGATMPFSLAANSGWQHTTFPLAASNFTAIGSPGSFSTLLSNFTGQFRILSSGAPSLQGDVITDTLGIDNIQAIPEPSTLVMVVAAFVMLGSCIHARVVSNH